MKEIDIYINEKLKLNKDIKTTSNNFHAKEITKENYMKFIQNDNMGLNLKDWYKKEYKTDKLGDDIPSITFGEALSIFFDDAIKFEDEVCVGDSLVRERIFNKFAKMCRVDYDNFYNVWLNS